MDSHEHLSRRERQIMDIIFALGQASVTAVVDNMTDPPTSTTVRTMMRILEEKGHLAHHKNGREFIYTPTKPRGHVGKSALNRVLGTFFEGSLEKAVAAHLTDDNGPSPEELERLAGLIRDARKQGR